MTTLETVITGVVGTFSFLTPSSETAHREILKKVFEHLSLNQPHALVYAFIFLSIGISLTAHFRHDVASLVSGFFEVALTFKKPETIDQSASIYLFLLSVLMLPASYFLGPVFHQQMSERLPEHLMTTVLLCAGSVLLWSSESFGKRNRRLMDLNGLDVFALVFTGAFSMFSGLGFFELVYSTLLFRRMSPTASTKLCMLTLIPTSFFLGTVTYVRGLSELGMDFTPKFWTAFEAINLSGLNFFVLCAVSISLALILTNVLLQYTIRNSLSLFAVYRVLLAIGSVAYFYKFN